MSPRILLDVDRWDRASDAEQDAAIAEVARRVEGSATYVRTERFTAKQVRFRTVECSACDGLGGKSPQSGNTDYPDCDVCHNEHEITLESTTEPMSHRVAVFGHRETGAELVLVPGRIEIAACLVGRLPYDAAASSVISPGLRVSSTSETRHTCKRAGAFDVAWETGAWRGAHPFGLVAADTAPSRLACTIDGFEAAQSAAFHELVDELGPIIKIAPGGWLVQMGYGTADPPDRVRSMGFSPDGKWLATGHFGDIRVWDTSNGRQHSRLGLPHGSLGAEIETVSFSPDGVRLVAASIASIDTFEVATGERLLTIAATAPSAPPRTLFRIYRAASWLPDGKLLVAQSSSNLSTPVTLSLVDPDTGEWSKSTSWPNEGLSGLTLAVSSDGVLAAVSLARKGKIAVWNLAQWEVVAAVAIEDTWNVAIGGRKLFANGSRVWKYDLAKPVGVKRGTKRGATQRHATQRRPTQLGRSTFSTIAASGDDTRVAWQTDAGVCVFDVARRRKPLLGDGSSWPFAFSPDGTRIATTAFGQAVIWAVPSP